MASTSRLPTGAIDRLLQAVKAQKDKADGERAAAAVLVAPAKRVTPSAASLDEREEIQIAYAKFRAEREKKQKADEQEAVKKLEKKLSDAKDAEVAEGKSHESDPMMELATKSAFVVTMREFVTTSVCRVLKAKYQEDTVRCSQLKETGIKLDILKFLNSEWHNYHKGNILPALQKIIDCKFIVEPTRLFHSCRILSLDVIAQLDFDGLITAVLAANKRPQLAARMTLDKFVGMIYGNTVKIFDNIDDETYDRFKGLPIPPTRYVNGRDLYPL